MEPRHREIAHEICLRGMLTHLGADIEDHLAHGLAAHEAEVRADEREKCAAFVETHDTMWRDGVAHVEVIPSQERSGNAARLAAALCAGQPERKG